jgi:hypothetical protein
MPISVDIYPTMPSRPCRFCLCLQGGSVFADFDVDDQGRAFLQRISFDGYGCCHGEFKKMSPDDSRVLLSAIERGETNGPRIEVLLRTYFQENADVIWRDALASYELLSGG